MMADKLQITRPGTNLLVETDRVFIRDADNPRTRVLSDGAAQDIKLQLVADRMHMMTVYAVKGTETRRHAHADHSTICCLLTGRLELHIGEQSFLAEPGDVWQYPRGIPHHYVALEDSSHMEIKSPAAKTW
jgi:quercetin dioxygenase-like cupin family protein